MSSTGKARALIARGMKTSVILATDNAALACDVEQVSDHPDDFLCAMIGLEPGLYLFEGEGHWNRGGAPWDDCEPELEWQGTVRTVEPSELPTLLGMAPPEEVS